MGGMTGEMVTMTAGDRSDYLKAPGRYYAVLITHLKSLKDYDPIGIQLFCFCCCLILHPAHAGKPFLSRNCKTYLSFVTSDAIIAGFSL